MNLDSKFLNKYTKSMTDIMLQINPNWDKKEVKSIILNMIKEQGKNPRVTLDNNYTGESRDTTLLSVLDWALDRKPILCGNATFYKNQHEAINPIAKMLEDFLSQRKQYKKIMFAIENSLSAQYKDLDRSQNNEKINCNSYYGASGAPSSAFYSTWSGPATTHSAQEVISTAENLFEGFIADNYCFINLNECIEWIKNILKNFRKDYDNDFDNWIQLRTLAETKDRLLNKILTINELDDTILTQYLAGLSDEELTILYYKNNIIEFIHEHGEIQNIIINIFECVENLDYVKKSDDEWLVNVPEEYRCDFIGKSWKDWNKFVNIQYFMNPNDPPESIQNSLSLLSKYLKKYIYCRYLSFDRIYRLKNFKRKVVTVIDTDSNILSLDTIINYIMDNVIKGMTFGRSYRNNIFICINMLAFVLSDVVEDILLTFGEYSNIPEEFRPIYNMKNEFAFLKLIIGKTKKRYISKIVLREGNLMDPPKYDIKGFDFKKATTSEDAEEFYMGLIRKYIIDSDDIELRDILRSLRKFKQDISDSIHSGDKRFLPNASAKEFAAYKNPASQPQVRGVLAWNILNPDNMIELPAKVSMLKLNIFDENDILPLKDTEPEIYNTIIDKIFNDTTGVFVQQKREPGVEYVSPNNKDKTWTKLIPKKYRSKYNKMSIEDGIREWNEFVDNYDYDSPEAIKEQTILKCVGMQVIAIPSNSNIPEWLQPYIDYSTIINNIIAPFVPVLEIFQSRTIEEGKMRKGVDRKSNGLSNIVKF